MANLAAYLITALAISDGLLLTYLVLDDASLGFRLAAGTVAGLAILAHLAFLLALALGLNTACITVTALILVATLAWLWWKRGARLRADIARTSWRINAGSLSYWIVWIALLAWLFSRVAVFKSDGLHTSPETNFGDLAFHLSGITSFAYGNNFPPQSPIFAGLRFTYPFLIDFLAAFFLRTGASLFNSLFAANLPLGLALVGLTGELTRRLVRPRLAARLAPVILFLSGGLGFFNFLQDMWQPGEGMPGLLAHLPRTYTINDDLVTPWGDVPLRWSNLVTTLIVPQRSLLFGLPLVALIVILWWLGVDEQRDLRERRRCMLAAGVLTGLMPLLHAHGVFAVAMASVAVAALFQSRTWIGYYVTAAILGGPQALWLSATQIRGKLFQPHFGWDKGESPFLLFWGVNAGVLILLLIVALARPALVVKPGRRFYLPFILWFVTPNLFLFAPWPWDNVKILIYWALLSCPFAAAACGSMLCSKRILSRMAGGLAIIGLTLAGALDVTRALSPVEHPVLLGPVELEVARMIREQTPPRSVIMHAPIHNSPVIMSGRPSLMGYPGHLWTHGIDYQERESDVNAIYSGRSDADELLKKYAVDYVILGPVERSQLKPQESFFTGHGFPVIIDYQGYRVYEIRKR
jgi:hypothetical protein